MANSKTHIVVGAVAGLALSALPQPDGARLSNPAAGATVGAFFGKVPDLLEPAFHPNHRQFFHSWAVVGGCIYGGYRLYRWRTTSPMETLVRGIGLVALGAYLSHLALDASTPKSLPLLGRF